MAGEQVLIAILRCLATFTAVSSMVTASSNVPASQSIPGRTGLPSPVLISPLSAGRTQGRPALPAFRSMTQVRMSSARENPARMPWTMLVLPEPVGPTTSAHCSRR